jgi:hypothetical protein
MPRPHRLSGSRRLINAPIKPLARLGLAGRHTYVLAVRGRKTGRRYETPVSLIENGDRSLVAPYGEVAWVWNGRAADEVELTRARRTERFRIEEVPAHEAASVLMRPLKAVPVVCPFSETPILRPVINNGQKKLLL